MFHHLNSALPGTLTQQPTYFGQEDSGKWPNAREGMVDKACGSRVTRNVALYDTIPASGYRRSLRVAAIHPFAQRSSESVIDCVSSFARSCQVTETCEFGKVVIRDAFRFKDWADRPKADFAR
jgi:hypothetical protein